MLTTFGVMANIKMVSESWPKLESFKLCWRESVGLTTTPLESYRFITPWEHMTNHPKKYSACGFSHNDKF